jgi:drug/metabolite transporter (DMT)-like permease
MPATDASTTSPSTTGTRWRLLLPYAGLAITMLCWAGNWVVGRAIRDAMPPIALNFWRWAVALIFLAPFALPRLRGKGEVLRRRWPILLALGATGIAMFQVLVYLGLRTTTTVNAVLMNSAAPLFIILCAWLMERDRASLRQIAGMLISFCGIVVIMERGDLAALAQFQFDIGDLVILAAMPVWGVYSVLLKRRPRELDGLELLFAVGAAGLLLLAPAYAAETLWFRAPTVSLESAAAVLYVALFASVLAYFCWNYGVAAVGPNRSGFMIHMLPAFGTLLAIVANGESVYRYHFAGIGTILAGVLLATTSRGR